MMEMPKHLLEEEEEEDESGEDNDDEYQILFRRKMGYQRF